MAGGFKGKQSDNSPAKINVKDLKQEILSPNTRGGGNTQSSNNDKKMNDRSHPGKSQHGGPPNNQHGGGSSSGDANSRGDVPGMSAASAAALSTRDEKKFTGRCRLFVGNLTPDITEEDFRKLFQPFGEISEVYVNAGKGFGFIRLVRKFFF